MKNRLESLDFYIKASVDGINITQLAINCPLEKNFTLALKTYDNWLLSLYEYLETLDKKTANLVIESPDGVNSSLNFFKGRASNIKPLSYSFVTYDKDKNTYVDELGIKNLENIILSYNKKILLLKELKIKITGGVLSNKNKEKVVIIFYDSGRIQNSLNNESLKVPRFSIIMRLIRIIREKDDYKSITLANKVGVERSNLSGAIDTFNKNILKEFKFKEDIIVEYSLNKQIYSFYFEDL